MNSALPPDTERPDVEAMLKRILSAVEQKSRSGWLELLTAVILSLATFASTWCGYQASQWAGKQSAAQAAADTAERVAAEQTIVGLQKRIQDEIAVMEYWRAMRQGEAEVANTIFERFKPALKAAIKVTLADGFLERTDVPGPFERPEYVLESETLSTQKREEAKVLKREATAAGAAAGSYVLLTLVFASVLFFGGIGSTFKRSSIRVTLACIALLIFAVALISMLRLPVTLG